MSSYILKPFQSETLGRLEKSFCHTLCVAPTGAGKGLIIEEYVRTYPSDLVLVLCPLIALGRQQAERIGQVFGRARVFCGMGLAGAGFTQEELSEANVHIISPEMLQNRRIQSHYERYPPALVVIDEAHCMEEWGAHFRPSYQEIIPFIRSLSLRKSLWLTATPPRSLEAKLQSEFGEDFYKVGTFSLPAGLHLALKELSLEGKVRALEHAMESVGQEAAGLVFVITRQHTERIQFLFKAHAKRALCYHAGFSSDERMILEKQVRRKPYPWVIATSAFGMGMDYKHFNHAFLFSPLHSVLSVVQALGRVGRNETQGCGVIFWHPEDLRMIANLSRRQDQTDTNVRDLFVFLKSTPQERTAWLKEYFA